ncbi:MAG: OmpA family protein [Salinivirgaceae bacterium]|jgi:OOP family OmpA-OmpF porin|nr:OmpA family protein [Salinivirgaceae bacterium]
MQQIDRNQIAYREYIRVQLTDTLKTGVAYFASMQIRLGLSCNICCNGLGMYFSSEALNSRIKSNYPVKPQVEYKNNLIIADKEKWTQVCGTFRASGNENYLIIGNFLSNQQMKYQVIDENLLQTQHTTPSAYYYIDNVEVIEYNDTLQLDCDGLVNKVPLAFKGELNRDTKWVLKNLYFDVDKAIILEESFYELDQLAAEMKSKVNYKINICGHTDNTGTADHNQQLSENRALAVRNYLLNKGISKFRMSFKGFGDTQPIAENNTKEGKQLNRRVEIEVF